MRFGYPVAALSVAMTLSVGCAVSNPFTTPDEGPRVLTPLPGNSQDGGSTYNPFVDAGPTVTPDAGPDPGPVQECTPWAREDRACTSGSGTETRACTATGQWESWSSCQPDGACANDAMRHAEGCPTFGTGWIRSRRCDRGTWQRWTHCLPPDDSLWTFAPISAEVPATNQGVPWDDHLGRGGVDPQVRVVLKNARGARTTDPDIQSPHVSNNWSPRWGDIIAVDIDGKETRSMALILEDFDDGATPELILECPVEVLVFSGQTELCAGNGARLEYRLAAQ